MVSPLGGCGIVATQGGETIIEEDGGKQAELNGEAGLELVDDLPWGETSFVGVGAVRRLTD